MSSPSWAIPERGEITAALDRPEAMLIEGRDRVTGLRRQSEAGESLRDALGAAERGLAAHSTTAFSANVLGESRMLKPGARD